MLTTWSSGQEPSRPTMAKREKLMAHVDIRDVNWSTHEEFNGSGGEQDGITQQSCNASDVLGQRLGGDGTLWFGLSGVSR